MPPRAHLFPGWRHAREHPVNPHLDSWLIGFDEVRLLASEALTFSLLLELYA
jgi:hypothetical protein